VRSRGFFTIGRVFKVLWTEPAGGRATAVSRDIYVTAFGEMACSKIRTFIVVRTASSYSTCVPIHTYGGRGVGKVGVDSKEHCGVYTGNRPPVNTERSPCLTPPVRIDPDDSTGRLDPCAVINLGKLYTIEHNVKVRANGIVNSRDLPVLLHHFDTVHRRPSRILEPVRSPNQGENKFRFQAPSRVNDKSEDEEESDDEGSEDDNDDEDEDDTDAEENDLGGEGNEAAAKVPNEVDTSQVSINQDSTDRKKPELV
jgi:hypothetical protein